MGVDKGETKMAYV